MKWENKMKYKIYWTVNGSEYDDVVEAEDLEMAEEMAELAYYDMLDRSWGAEEL